MNSATFYMFDILRSWLRQHLLFLHLGNFLSFAFPLLSPLMFYVVLLNTTNSFSLLAQLPSLPSVIGAWMILLPLAYFQLSHRAWMEQ